MAFEFDPDKDAINRRKHGFPLAYGLLVFDGSFIEVDDIRRPYGEPRFVAIGPFPAGSDILYSVTFTWRGPLRRLISVRRASDKEARTYHRRYSLGPRRGDGLLARRKAKVAAVALANRNARIIWAMMASGERCREPQVA